MSEGSKSVGPLSVGPSKIQGFGVFSEREFRGGERICTFAGHEVSLKSYETLFLRGNCRASVDPLQVGVHRYMTLEDPFNQINHSCAPNSAVRGTRTLFAIRRIHCGDEITFDYSAVEWTPQDYPPYYANEWPMVCACCSTQCRKLVTCFPYLPTQKQKEYLRLNAVPRHILAKLNWPAAKQRCFVCEWKLLAVKECDS